MHHCTCAAIIASETAWPLQNISGWGVLMGGVKQPHNINLYSLYLSYAKIPLDVNLGEICINLTFSSEIITNLPLGF